MKVNGKVKACSNSAETPHSDDYDHGREDDHDHEHESDDSQEFKKIFLPFPHLCSAQAGQRYRGSCQPSHPKKT